MDEVLQPTPSVLTPSDSVLPTTKSRPLPTGRRRVGDVPALRQAIYDRVLDAAHDIQPVSNSRHTLSLHDIDYEGAADFPLAKQKEVLLAQGSLHRRLRGNWRLTDNASGNVLDEKRTTLAEVPYLTNRGTFVLDGTEYVLRHQLRLMPGIYSRQKANSDLEAHVNVVGTGHRLYMAPDTGVFKLHIAQANIPLLPALRVLGATDQELRKAWGPEILAANIKHDSPHHINHLYEKFVRRPDRTATDETKREALKRTLEGLSLDPEVTKQTLGKPYDHYGKDVILDTTKKLLALNRGEVEPDDRDHMAYQQVMGPEDLLAERIGRNRMGLNKVLWQSSFRGNLAGAPAGLFNRSLRDVLMTSGLGQTPEGISAAEFIDHSGRITRLGEGGLSGGAQSVPDESRNVSASQFGFIDLIKTPESASTGVDLHMAFGVHKGDDGRLYAPFTDIRSGRLVYRSPQQLTSLVVALPGELKSGKKYVSAIREGRLRFVNRDTVDLESPSMENAFSPLTNMVPLKSAAKAQRGAMGARMLTQSLPLLNAEAPLVRGAIPGQPGRSWEELYGRHMGAVHAEQDGRVEKVTPDEIVVRYSDGTKKTHELYRHWAGPRKTGLHNEALVRPGEIIKTGQLLAKSNFTDDNGHAALGLNTRVVYTNVEGKDFEDAAIISESYAKRLTSGHYYQHKLDHDEADRRGKNNYIHLFPGKYDRKLLANMDDDGVIKPGTEVQPGDPLILRARHREMDYGKVTTSSRASFADATETWEHGHPGIVTDVVKHKRGINVVVKSEAPMQVGDKLCFDEVTQILTRGGWKPAWAVTTSDWVLCLENTCAVWQHPTETFCYSLGGPMYKAVGPGVNLFVTSNHRLYCREPNSETFSLSQAAVVGETAVCHLKAVRRLGDEPKTFLLPSMWPSQTGKSAFIPDKEVPVEPFLKLLGLALRDGSYVSSAKSASFFVKQAPWASCDDIVALIKQLGLDARLDNSQPDRVEIRSTHLVEYLHCLLGRAQLPDAIPGYSQRLCQLLLSYWLGPLEKLVRIRNVRWADEIHRLAILAGVPADIVRSPYFRVYVRDADRTPDVKIDVCLRVWSSPETKAVSGHLLDNYQGPVFCVTVPNHILMVRRKGRAIWCGNSQRWGGKSVISEILPDDQMPHGEDGQPFEMAASPLSLLSRVNPAWVIESALGKVAAKTGKPYVIEDFKDIPNLTQFAMDELAKHGLSDTETITDPKTGRKIPGVLAGVNFIMKLHHTSEGKVQGRGLGTYSAEGTPARGAAGGAKRLSLSDTHALLSGGATTVLQDAREHRAGNAQEFWLAYMSGFPTPPVRIPAAYDKLLNHLKGSGLNVVREGPRLRLLALTNNDVQELSGDRELQNAETVQFDKGLKPVAGGLFAPDLTGGHGGTMWAKITLAEPLPNPAFAVPIRKLLGLTEQRYLGVLAGKEELHDQRGPTAIANALANLNIKQEMARARQEISSGRRSYRDDAVRRLGYLKTLDSTGMTPSDWILRSVPVLPPKFRPVSLMAGGRGQLISDPNYLYKELFDANENVKNLKPHVSDLSEERLALYRSFEGVVGLGDPTQPKNIERGVKGLLASVFGSGPKFSLIQQKLLGSTVETVGRAVISPDADLDMDHVGLPEKAAYDVYGPMVVRHLVRNGMPRTQAIKELTDRTPVVKKTLEEVMASRPVLLTRAPLLHRYGSLAFYPRLARGDTIQVSPIVYKGFNADNDGDCVVWVSQVSLEIDFNSSYISSVATNITEKGLFMQLVKKHKVEITNQVARLSIPIGEFPRVGEPTYDKNGNAVYSVPEGVRVLTYDHQSGAVSYAPVTSFIVEENYLCFRVMTRGKRSVEVSGNQSLATYNPDNDQLVRIAPSEAKGRLVPYVRRPPAAPADGAFDFDTGWWYGALVTDGGVHGNTVAHTKLDNNKRAKFLAIAGKLFGADNFTVHEYEGVKGPKKLGDSISLRLTGAELVRQVLPVYNSETCNALHKCVPSVLLDTGSRECLLGLLSGILDGDAYVGYPTNPSRKKPQFAARISTSSPQLRDDSVRLCKLLGIRTGVITYPANSVRSEAYAVGLSTPDLYRLAPELRLVDVERAAALKQLTDGPTPKDDLDIVPISKDLVAKLTKVMLAIDKTLYVVVRKADTTGYLGRSSAERICKLVDPNKVEGLTDWNRRFVSCTDICWDIYDEVVETTRQTVFDLAVPSTKVFVTDHGLVVWDTMQFHLPVSDEAAQDAADKMLPSHNLFAPATMKATAFVPTTEYLQGIHAASHAKDEHSRPKVFATRNDALRAFRRGEIGLGQPVEIVQG